ncbi:MAG: hypothetical protein SCH98_18030 [Deferrisomatales bacterium]|nr:hypothetical protein [Deferrisomatales bacterium]
MRIRSFTLALAAAGILSLGLASTGLALHDGGVARCEACHTMHNSHNGAIHDADLIAQFTTGPMLLKGSDASSACLNCHASTTLSSYRVLTTGLSPEGIPAQRTPGGDFAFLLVGTSAERKSMRGHNVIALDSGLAADTRDGMATGPGGDYPNADLGCHSCHDPHGKYRVDADGNVSTTGLPISKYGSYGEGNSAYAPTGTAAVGAYRILAGTGYLPKSLEDTPGLAFVNQVPMALTKSTYNVANTDTKVAYGSGMSEWCANCHGQIYNDNYPTHLRHPSGDAAKLPSAIVANYNAYVKSGDMTGTFDTAYWTLVPFEKGLGFADRDTLAGFLTTDETKGAAATDNVMCLSCHRVHASAFDHMLRWDDSKNLVASGGAYPESGGLTVEQIQAGYYGKPATDFATYQRSLCNKCHAKD